MSEVIKIKVALLVGFCLQLVYFTWFIATSLGELRQEIQLNKNDNVYNRDRLDKIESAIEKYRSR